MYIVPKPIEVKALQNYDLYIKFDDGKEKIYNVKHLVENIPFYCRLKEKEYFENVKIDGNTITWTQGEDIAPENLYYDSVSFVEYK